MTQSNRLGSALVACCLMLAAGNVARAATVACAFGDAPDLQAAIEAHSPLHLVKSMPDIPYFVVHSTADRSVGKERHSDRFVAAMKAAGRRIDYVASVGTGHGRLTAAAHARLSAAVLAPFVGEADVRALRRPARSSTRSGSRRANTARSPKPRGSWSRAADTLRQVTRCSAAIEPLVKEKCCGKPTKVIVRSVQPSRNDGIR